MYDHTFYKQVQICRSDIKPHLKWAFSLVILHMVTSIFLRALCGYIWVNILTLSPRGSFLHIQHPEGLSCTWMCRKDPLGDKVSILTHIYPHKAQRKIEVTILHLDVDFPNFQQLERLTVVLYDKSSPLTCISEVRKNLFCDSRAMDKLPPTQNALLQHSKRVVHQAGIWTTSMHTHQLIPFPQEYVWNLEFCVV